MKIQTVKGILGSNTFIVEYGGAVVLVDAGAPTVELVKTLGKRKPDAILLTHEHFDHVEYLKDYKTAFDCQVISPDDESEIVIKDLIIKPILCPGHSPKSVCYLIKDCLFTGDVLFDEGIGRTDLPGSCSETMQETLQKLLTVKFTTAYHGHDDPSTYEQQQKNIRSYL